MGKVVNFPLLLDTSPFSRGCCVSAHYPLGELNAIPELARSWR